MTATPVPTNPRLVALLGWPVAHSVSPHLHNASFREHGLDLVYVAVPCHPERLAATVATLGEIGTIGANVTVPHKQAVVALCDGVTDEAELVGAVNTLHWTPDGLVGDNTDAVGLGAVIRDDLATSAGDRVVVLGTGGAARAVAVAFGRVGAALTVVGRRADAAQSVAELGDRAGATSADAVDLEQTAWVEAAVADAEVVVNATPLGLDGEQLPAPFTRVGGGQRALDLIYNPVETPWLAAARGNGAEPHHGLGMLIGQAAAAYRTWTGREAPTGTMSAVALRVLGAQRGHAAPPDA